MTRSLRTSAYGPRSVAALVSDVISLCAFDYGKALAPFPNFHSSFLSCIFCVRVVGVLPRRDLRVQHQGLVSSPWSPVKTSVYSFRNGLPCSADVPSFTACTWCHCGRHRHAVTQGKLGKNRSIGGHRKIRRDKRIPLHSRSKLHSS